MFANFFTTALAVLAAIAIWKFFSRKIGTPYPGSLVTPLQALYPDLGVVFARVNTVLNRDFKTSAFPVKIDIGQGGWCDDESRVEVVSAQLQLVGWYVTRSPECSPTEIVVDIPRARVCLTRSP